MGYIGLISVIGSLALNSTVFGNRTPFWEVRAGANACRILELEIGISSANIAGGERMYIGRPSNITTQTGAVTVLAENPSDGGLTATCATTWSAAPDFPETKNIIRQLINAATVHTFYYLFHRGLKLLTTRSLTAYHANAGLHPSGMNCHVLVDE